MRPSFANHPAASAKLGRIVAESSRALEAEELGDVWRDWVIAHTLHSEAEQVIKGEASSAASDRPAE